MRLGVVTSHPIQYQAPLFRALAQRVDLTVYFAHRATAENQAEAGFKVGFDWDTDLMGGYRHFFLENVSRRPGITHFTGCDTPSISETLAADKVDVLAVYGWHLKSYLQAARAARLLRIPVMVRSDSHLDTPRSLMTRAAKAISYPLLLRQFDMFLPTGTRSIAYLRHYGVPQARIHVVPYCIDVEMFMAGATRARINHGRLRTEFRANDGEKIVLFVGKLIDLKAVPILVEALARLTKAGKALRLFIVGSGPRAEQLRGMINARSLPASFIGFVNQSRMPEIYAVADVLVLPSYSETWGLVVNEAFACGLPAIVSDRVGCAPDLITDRLTGSVVPAGDIEALVQALDFWTGARENLESRRAMDEINAHYSPSNAAAAFVTAAQIAVSSHRSGIAR